MKVFKTEIKVDITWKFDGTTLVSSDVNGHTCRINKSMVVLYRGSIPIKNVRVINRSRGMYTGTKLLESVLYE